MERIKDLDRLLRGMKPELAKGEYVFCTLPKSAFDKMRLEPLLACKEREGITVVVERKAADANSLAYSGVWALVTLAVHSDLSAIGFLARITEKLAEAGISVNVVSAYHHDHLFVPLDLAEKAMKILAELSKSMPVA